jgi:hypothetical protein
MPHGVCGVSGFKRLCRCLAYGGEILIFAISKKYVCKIVIKPTFHRPAEPIINRYSGNYNKKTTL